MKTTNAAVQTKSGKAPKSAIKKDGFVKRFKKQWFLFLLFLPALVYYIMFKYVPMWGVSICFFDYNPYMGWEASPFIGLRNFEVFFKSPMFWPYTRNTLLLGLQDLLISFPTIVLFSLLLNEVRGLRFKKVVQTVSYMPHFLSVVVIIAMVKSMLDPVGGGIMQIVYAITGDSTPINLLMDKNWFRPIYLISGIWQGLGWGTIVYLAAISSVDPGLYEAARLDGAGRWRQMWSITLPSIAPTVSTMFILKIGHVMDASMEKVLLLQQPITYETSQILSTFVYQIGITSNQFSYSTAVGLYSSVINLVFLFIGNKLSEKLTDSGIF